jgi:hypothetical protein
MNPSTVLFATLAASSFMSISSIGGFKLLLQSVHRIQRNQFPIWQGCRDCLFALPEVSAVFNHLPQLGRRWPWPYRRSRSRCLAAIGKAGDHFGQAVNVVCTLRQVFEGSCVCIYSNNQPGFAGPLFWCWRLLQRFRQQSSHRLYCPDTLS